MPVRYASVQVSREADPIARMHADLCWCWQRQPLGKTTPHGSTHLITSHCAGISLHRVVGGGRARAPRDPALGRAETKWEAKGRGLGLDVVMGW